MLKSRGTGDHRRRFALPIAPIAALLFLILGAPAALAAPGDNGDVKIHASTTPVGDQRDDTHVCSFYLDAFNFDTVQQVSWTIHQQPPTGTAKVDSGTITLTNGAGHTADMTLPTGHYKLTWTFAGEHGRAKQKVFFSDCVGPSPSPSQHNCPDCPSPSQSASASASAMPSTSGSMMASPSASHGAGGGKLAQTGASLLPAAGGAAVLVLTGTLLTRRSRKSAHTR